MQKEIERRWLIPHYPELPILDEWEFWTRYLFVGEKFEIRLQSRYPRGISIPRFEPRHSLDVKLGNGLSRIEEREIITLEQRDTLTPDDLLQPILKQSRDYAWSMEQQQLMIHASRIDNKEFYMAEIEFPSEDMATRFVCPFPDWIDVTADPQWAMKNYWLKTRKKGEVPYA